MIEARRLFWAGVGLAVLPLAAYYAMQLFPYAAGLALLVGVVWALGEYRSSARWLRFSSMPWLSDLCFALALGLAAGVIFTGGAWPLALLAALAALAAWDLRSYSLRNPARSNSPALDRSHLAALGLTLAFGLAAALASAAAGLWLDFKPGLGLAWLLGLLAAAGLVALGKIWLK